MPAEALLLGGLLKQRRESVWNGEGGGNTEEETGLLFVGDNLLANGFGVSHYGSSGEALGVMLHTGAGASGGAAVIPFRRGRCERNA
eukprot:scaffold294_cov131-Isochrysis_galbana.AAC.3